MVGRFAIALPLNVALRRCAALVTIVSAAAATIAAQPANPDPALPAKTPEPAKTLADPLQGLGEFPFVIVAPSDPKTPFNEDGTIIIERKSFEEWKRRQREQMARRDNAAVAFDIRANANVEGASFRFVARFAFRVESPEGAWVPLDCREGRATDIQMREQISAPPEAGGVRSTSPWIPPIKKDAHGFAVRVDRAGSYECELDLIVPTTSSPTGDSIKVSLPPSVVSRVTVTSRDPLASLRAGEPSEAVALSEDRRTAEVSLRSAESLSLSWRSMSEALHGPSSIASVEGLVMVRVEEGRATTNTTLDIIATGDVRQARLRIPPSNEVREVRAEQGDISLPHELDVVDEDGAKSLTLRFERAVAGTMRIRVASDVKMPPADRSLPKPPPRVVPIRIFEVEGASQQSGAVLVSWSSSLWVRSASQSAAQRIGVNELPLTVQETQPRLAFSYSNVPATIDLSVEDARPSLAAVADHDLRIGGESATVTSIFRVSVRGAQADSLTLRVPKTMRIVEALPANLTDVADREEAAGADTRLVNVTLAEPVLDGELELSIRGEIAVSNGMATTVTLPRLEANQFVRGTLAVRAEPGVRLSLNDAASEYLRREPIPDGSPGDPPVDWYFRLQSGPSRIAFAAQVLPMRMQASVDAELRRIAGEIEIRSFVRFHADNATFDQVALAIPEGINDLQITGESLADLPSTEPGSIIIGTENPMKDCELRIAYKVPVAQESSNEVQVPLVQPRSATLSSWRARVFCDRGWRATALGPWISSKPSPSLVVTSGERPEIDVRPGYLESPPDALSLRFEPTATMATLVIPRVLVDETATSDGRRSGRKVWMITRHRTRDVAFRLPADTRLLDVEIDGQAVDPVAYDARAFRVRLPSTESPCMLTIEYDSPSRRSDGAFSIRTLDGPTLVDDAAIEQVRWILRVPRDRLLARLGSADSPGLAWQFPGILQAGPKALDSKSANRWLTEFNPNATLPDSGAVTGAGGRTWEFDTYGDSETLSLVSIREPFWILVCSGGSFIILLAITRLNPMAQIRVGAVVALVMVGLLAVTPNVVYWLWFGAQWGVYVGLIAVAIHYWLLYRRFRAYSVGLRRFNARQLGFGSSILRRFEPKTRVTSSPAVRQA